MKKCLVITAYIEGTLSEALPEEAPDFTICADGGYDIALTLGLAPDLVIGDADSAMAPPGPESGARFICFPREKDESDTFLCVKHAVNLGFEDITIAGGIGGRLDHTISNIQTLAYFSNRVKRIALRDERNYVTVIEDARLSLPEAEGFSVSLFSLSDECGGVTVEGLLFPLRDTTLKNDCPVGLSNVFTSREAFIEVKKGKLLVVMSKLQV
jgi:thiamine pyrophosphokinase